MSHFGIYGGSFNPIHLGHLLVAQSVCEACKLDRVLFMPCNVSPLKFGARDLAAGRDRLEMVRLSVDGCESFEPSGLDLERGGVSYALDTVRALKSSRPEDRLSFIIGMDSLRELSHWHRIDEMLELCDVITVERPGVDVPLGAGDLPFPERVRERLLANIVRGRHCEISSTEIRRRIAEGRSIRYLVHPAVENYILSRGLYAHQKEAND